MISDKYFDQQLVDDVSYVGNSDEGEIILDYAEANYVDKDSIAYSNDDGTEGLLFIWENENLVNLENVETGAKVPLYKEAG